MFIFLLFSLFSITIVILIVIITSEVWCQCVCISYHFLSLVASSDGAFC